jgi:2-succinyl-5-enolpyruvyl-6-hydroxy-3-cyclohexene-1-carboxylate synthase
LVVLTADRPPELRGIGAGQTIDQIKLYGESVRWFCEVGTHEADDDGLLHYRSVACRALAAARGKTRPGPVHLNLPWREPLAPLSIEGAVTATDPLALEGRDNRPLTAVTSIDLEPSAFLLDEMAGHIGDAISGVIVAGRQLDPELREPLAHLARASGFPILAEPTSQLRCGPHDRSYVISTYDLLLCDDHFARSVVPDLVLRFGELPTSKPLRSWLSASGADQIVIDPYSGWNEPTNRAAAILRADPTELAAGWATRLEKEERPAPQRWLDAEQAACEAIESAFAGGAISEPALHHALGQAHRDGDLVYTASSMPIRDQEAFLPPGETDVTFLCNRGANGIDGLISSGIGAAHASGKPTTIVTGDLGLLHDIGSLAALRDVTTPVRIVVIDNNGGGIFGFLPQAEALGDEEFEALLGTPKGLDVAKAAQLFDLFHQRLESLANLPAALAAGTGLIEVRTDRGTNVEAHRGLARRVHDALPG